MDSDTHYCRECKAVVAEGAKFCAGYGAEIADATTVRWQMEVKREAESWQRQVWWLRLVAFFCSALGAVVACFCVHRGTVLDREEALGLFLASFVGFLAWWILFRLQALELAWFLPTAR